MHFVITGVRSRTHLVYLAAYLRQMLEGSEGRHTLAYEGGGRFLGSAIVDEADVRRMLPADPRLEISVLDGPGLGSGDERELTYLAVGAPGLKPWIALRRNGIRRRIRVVVTDEGLGTYGDWRTRRAAWARQGVREPKLSVRTAAVTAGERLLTDERFATYDRAADWSLNPVIRDEFLRWVRGGRADVVGDQVVLLTQPWVDISALTETQYLGHVEQVRKLVSGQGLRLLVRPHPAEPIERYRDFEVLASDLPAELDPRVVNSAAVIGGSSTGLLNLAALYDLPAARVLVPGLEHLESEVGSGQRSLLARYVPAARPVAQLGSLG